VIWAIILLLGLVLGSFLNVLIHRLPRKESIVSPPSHCPRCGRRIRPYDNVPVLSYILLRGRCRDCRKRISPRYPLVETATGLLFLAVYVRFGPSWASARACVLVCLLVVTALIDLDHQIIPFRISIPGLVIGLAASLLPQPAFRDALIGAAAGAAFIAFAGLLWRCVLAPLFRRFGIDQKEGMGGGDLPYAAMIGAFLGWRATIVALFAAVVFGVFIGLAARSAGRNRRGQPIPFGPFLALGGLVGLFFGNVIFAWYVGYILR
jgi:leader peptidase (prepilin peptidase)/N-methyltransferase